MFKSITRLCFMFLFLVAGLPSLVCGQETITETEQQSVIDSLIHSLENNYVFPQTAKEMGRYLRKQLKADAYKKLTNPIAFGDQLTADLQSISHDKHLRVQFNPDGAQAMRQGRDEGDDGEPDEEFLKSLQRDNFGFKEVKMLEGNVGYLDLRGFMSPAHAGEKFRPIVLEQRKIS